MRQRYSGDGQYHLPAGRVEPYRLWFEFLKLALQDPDIKVDRQYYRAWGDISSRNFDDWWSTHWRKLFAIDNGVRIIDGNEKFPLGDPSILVRLPLGQDVSKTLKDVKALLEERATGKAIKKLPKGKYALSESAEIGFLKKMAAVRAMLRAYGYWLKHDKKERRHRVEATALDYYNWANNYNTGRIAAEKKRGRKWKSPPIYVPECFNVYVAWLADKKKHPAATFTLASNSEGVGLNAENSRKMIVRYINKARKLAANVGRGEFPGKY